jgi:uncharacterized membrane protein YphA (DoxX/SURF4 family)
MNSRRIGYWTSTLVVAFIFISSGICYVIGLPQVVAGVVHLGYPPYFVTLLGTWKVLGGIAILLPGFARLKEWAYAGMIFDLTGAAFSSTAIGNAWWHILAPLSVAAVVVVSWALRPPGDRVIGTVRLWPATSAVAGHSWMRVPKAR